MASPRWSCREIDANHSVPSNEPDELARFLLELARPLGRDRHGTDAAPN